MLLALCAVVMIVGTAFGAFAYLADQDLDVNTFTEGTVNIHLDEARVNTDSSAVGGADRVHDNKYHLIPGHAQ